METPGQFVYYDGSRPVAYYKTETETYWVCPSNCTGGGGPGGGIYKEIYDPSDPEQYDKFQSNNLDEAFDALDPKIQTQMSHVQCACQMVERTRTVQKLSSLRWTWVDNTSTA